MKKFTILAGAALLAIAGTAMAQPAGAPRADRNADVTRQQVVERTEQRFARLDLNDDGRVTAEEARQAGEQRRAQRAGQAFERLDLNRDGNISRAEFDQARSQRAERRAEAGPHRRMRGMRGMRGHGGQRMFGDQGFVTREQFEQRALARFDRLDSNRDGTLTAAERQQARETMRQRMRERRGRNG